MVLTIGVVAKHDAIGLSRKTFAGSVVFTTFSCIIGFLFVVTPGWASVSFRNDVMAVISKAGCNAGTCHGKQNGKAGFKLSLRGEDPEFEYNVLTRDAFARRTNPLEPEQSLILLKPTAQIAHEGGQRFKRGSQEYDILLQWISAGLPNDLAEAPKLTTLEVAPRDQILYAPTTEPQLHGLAKFSDGSERD